VASRFHVGTDDFRQEEELRLRSRRGRRRLQPAAASVLALLVFAVSGCASQPAATAPVPAGGSAEGLIRLYTSVTQDTVDAVLEALAEAHPRLQVEVFRAPTGELDARIAAERRSGGVTADVLWATDPLSVHAYEADGLLRPLDDVAPIVAPEYRSASSVGTRLLNMVIVARADLERPPRSWAELAEPRFAGGVALPDPGFAGSAFAALGYFATTPEYGMDYYRRLRDNGAVQLASIGDVVTGVAEGRFVAGITLDKPARDALERGSPIELIWPTPGAIALYSPAAIFADSRNADAARMFVEFLVSAAAQRAIADTGWQPVRRDVAWPHAGPVVTPDWTQAFGRQQELLDEYRTIFGD
jgi:iron(III) transport system substrate-binding protein